MGIPADAVAAYAERAVDTMTAILAGLHLGQLELTRDVLQQPSG
jgi:hypothetical protein